MYCAQSPLKLLSKSEHRRAQPPWPGRSSTIVQRAAWMNDSARSLSPERRERPAELEVRAHEPRPARPQLAHRGQSRALPRRRSAGPPPTTPAGPSVDASRARARAVEVARGSRCAARQGAPRRSAARAAPRSARRRRRRRPSAIARRPRTRGDRAPARREARRDAAVARAARAARARARAGRRCPRRATASASTVTVVSQNRSRGIWSKPSSSSSSITGPRLVGAGPPSTSTSGKTPRQVVIHGCSVTICADVVDHLAEPALVAADRDERAEPRAARGARAGAAADRVRVGADLVGLLEAPVDLRPHALPAAVQVAVQRLAQVGGDRGQLGLVAPRAPGRRRARAGRRSASAGPSRASRCGRRSRASSAARRRSPGARRGGRCAAAPSGAPAA